MRHGAIHTARIIDFPRRISIARAFAKPWTFICNLMNDTPTRSVLDSRGWKIANSIRRSYSLARATTQSVLLIGSKIQFPPYEFSFSGRVINTLARIDSRFSTDDSICSHRASFMTAFRGNSVLQKWEKKKKNIKNNGVKKWDVGKPLLSVQVVISGIFNFFHRRKIHKISFLCRRFFSNISRESRVYYI